MSDLATLIDNLTVSLRPHAATPVTVRRLDRDSPAPAAPSGTGEIVTGVTGRGDGRRRKRNTNANRRNGGGSCYYRPKADHYAGGPPATTVPNAPRMTPAKPMPEDTAYRTVTSSRRLLVEASAEIPAPGTMYPNGTSRRGNPAIRTARTR
ncbi:MAG TPA: hypothetical protein VHE33_10070 [Acidobacteriaceae bacterium]|nr:hypothetical protein [Acidobacteriaceae bacterium]